MTATEKLRALLDERGVEHEDKYTELAPDISGWYSTWWQGIAGMTFMAISDETVGREDCVYINETYLTPEQAIAATLGSDREAELEALVKELYENAVEFNFKGWIPYYRDRFAALGIEVDNDRNR